MLTSKFPTSSIAVNITCSIPGRGLHLNIKGMLQFAKYLIEGSGNYEIKKKLAGQKVDLSKSHTPYDHHHFRTSPVVDNIFLHDSNILKKLCK